MSHQEIFPISDIPLPTPHHPLTPLNLLALRLQHPRRYEARPPLDRAGPLSGRTVREVEALRERVEEWLAGVEMQAVEGVEEESRELGGAEEERKKEKKAEQGVQGKGEIRGVEEEYRRLGYWRG